jgi:hypothetical protein
VLGLESFFKAACDCAWFGLGVEERGVPTGVVSRFEISRTVGFGGRVSADALSSVVPAALDLPSGTSPSSASAADVLVLLPLSTLVGCLGGLGDESD